MAVPHSLSPELKVHTFYSSVNPHRKAVTLVSLVSIRTLFIQAVTKYFYLRCTTEFQNSKFYGLLCLEPILFLLGERVDLTTLLLFARPLAEKRWHNHEAVCSLCQHRAESWHSFPTLMPGNSAPLRQIPHSSYNSGNPETTLSYL